MSVPSPIRPMPQDPVSRGRRGVWSRVRPRGLRGWSLWVFGAVVVGMGVAWGLSRMTPPWYVPLDATDMGVIDASENVQKRYLDLRNRIGALPTGQQSWKIAQHEINSFMAITIKAPADGKVPVVSDPLVIFTPGKVTLSVRSTKIPGSDPRGGVGSLVFSVSRVKGADGKEMGLVKLTRVWIGRLPVPISVVKGRLKALEPQVMAAVSKGIQLNLNLADAIEVTPAVEDWVRAAIEGEPFPLEYKKKLIVKEFNVDDGTFSLLLAPPVPAAVRPRPASPGH